MVYGPPLPTIFHSTSSTSNTSPTPTATASNLSTTTTATKPTASGSTSKTTPITHPHLGQPELPCDVGCKATLGVVMGVLLLSLIIIAVYLAWGKKLFRKRKEKKAKAVEDGVAMRKLGDGGSVSEWGSKGEGELRDVEIRGEEGASGARKSKMGRWWKR